MSVLNGPPPSTQIINLERMVSERDAEIENLRARVERAEAALAQFRSAKQYAIDRAEKAEAAFETLKAMQDEALRVNQDRLRVAEDRMLDATARAEKAEAELKTARAKALKEAANHLRSNDPIPDVFQCAKCGFMDTSDRAYWLGSNNTISLIEALAEKETGE